MRWTYAAGAVGLAVLGMMAVARGEGFTPASVPADARWVIHVDGDAVRSSKLWDMIEARFIAPHQMDFDEKTRIIETLTGMKFPTDLHDVTLYGTAFTKEDTCILIHAVVDQAKVTNFLKLDAEFKSTAHNDHDVLTWRDKGQDRLLHAAFFGTDRIIVAQNERLVEAALDAMDGKAEVLKGSAALAAPPPLPALAAPAPPSGATLPAGIRPGTAGDNAAVMLYVAGQELGELQKAQNPASPIIAQTEGAWLAISQGGDRLVANLWIKAKSEKGAEQIQDLAKGVRALLALAAAAEHADDKTKAANAALENLTVYHDGGVVSAKLAMPLERFRNLLEANHIGATEKAAPDATTQLP